VRILPDGADIWRCYCRDGKSSSAGITPPCRTPRCPQSCVNFSESCIRAVMQMTECAARSLVIWRETAVLEEQYRFLKVLDPGL